MRRLSAVLLSVCLLLSLTAPALAAAQTSGAASTLRLESVEGTANLKDAGGKALKTTSGARLYNGYALSTKKASYAFVSLDNSKAIKLDASTSTEVFQSGKKLEMKVTAGQMFFNVTAPLKSNESMKIRTSTMVTGVRGTSGWVEVADRHTTRISLLEGELTVVSIDPQTGAERSTTIVGGQTLTVVYEGKGHGYDISAIGDHVTIQELIDQDIIHEEHIILTGTGLTVEALQEEDVPGFVAIEVANDKELQKKIEETTDLSVPEIIDGAEEKLEQEEAAAEKQDQKIQEQLENLTAEKVDPLFEEEEESSSGGGGSSAPALPAIQFDGSTVNELNSTLAAANGADVIVNSEITDANPNSIITVPANQTMILEDGADLKDANITVDGTMSVTGSDIQNTGIINVNSTNSLEISGTLTNNGSILVGDTSAGALRILSGGELINTDGVIFVGSQSNSTATGLLEVQSGGTLTNNGSVIVGLENSSDAAGTMTIASNATVTGNIVVETTGTLTNNGTINGSVNNSGALNHYGTISADANSNVALTISRGSTTLISGASVQDAYHVGGTGSQVGTSDGYALLLEYGSMDPNTPVEVRIENGSLIQSTGAAISSRDGSSGVIAYGFKITVADSTIKSNTYAIDASTFGIGETNDEEPTTITSTIDITNSTLVGGTAAINEDPAAVTITMDAATEENNQSAADTLVRYTVYFHDNDFHTFTTPEEAMAIGAPSDEFIGGIPKSLSPSDWDNRNGYTQTGWNTEPDGSGTFYELHQVLDEAIVPEGEDAIILYAQWSANKFTVNFDLNGADDGQTAPDSMQNVTYESSFTLPNPTTPPTKGNLFFIGWYNEEEQLFAPGATISNLEVSDDGGEYVFTAAWADYKLVYHKNVDDAVGETSDSYHCKDGEDYQDFSECGFVSDNYFFLKWCDSTGTFSGEFSFSISELNAYVEAQAITDGIINLYAQWWPIVTVYANDGSDAVRMVRLPPTLGLSQSLSPLFFSRDGYTISSWNTEADGSGISYAASHSFTYDSAAHPFTLYAQWTPIPVTTTNDPEVLS